MKYIFTILLAIISILLISIGFYIGRTYQHTKDKLHIEYLETKIKAMKCAQYTVLDSEHVITACNDTLKYNWRQR